MIEPLNLFAANVITPQLPVPKGPIYQDLEDKRRRESRNGYIQAEFVVAKAQEWDAECSLTPDLLCELQRLAVNQIYRCAGHFRDGPVTLGVEHKPPEHTEVPGLVAAMCDYVNENWPPAQTPVHLAAYLMWRMNWIHPFFGGNGRTARAVSYLVLCAGLGFVLPGRTTMPELIVADRSPYYRALREADKAWASGKLDVEAMEQLMSELLAQQLLQVHEQATGRAVVPEDGN